MQSGGCADLFVVKARVNICIDGAVITGIYQRQTIHGVDQLGVSTGLAARGYISSGTTEINVVVELHRCCCGGLGSIYQLYILGLRQKINPSYARAVNFNCVFRTGAITAGT